MARYFCASLRLIIFAEIVFHLGSPIAAARSPEECVNALLGEEAQRVREVESPRQQQHEIVLSDIEVSKGNSTGQVTPVRVQGQHALSEELASFVANPRFDGSVRVPPGISFTGRSSGGLRFAIHSENISTQPARLKRMILDLKRRSNVSQSAREREYAALIVTYADGTSRAVRMTSNLVDTVTGLHQTLAAEGAELFSNPSQITSVLHIHTHPNLNNPYLPDNIGRTEVTFSGGDLEMYDDLQRQLSAAAGHHIPIRAIVIPGCSLCDDLIFTTEH